MKNRNIYKDIVFLAIGCMMTAFLVWAGNFWLQQQKTYEIIIRSQEELTEEIVTELSKIEGLYQFTPSASCHVTLKLDEYTLETSVTGVVFEHYPVEWSSVQKEIVLGGSPVLFFGEEAFASFADDNGNAPGRGRISSWTEKFQELELTVTDESGRERRARIGGVLKTPSSGIFMSMSQMQEIYASSTSISGGSAKIQGCCNLKKAQEILSGAGFQVE